MSRRSYQQSCPLARALDAVGERWTLLVIRELLLGPQRYGQIHDRLPGIGTNLLADRLKTLERLGLVEKTPGDGRHRWGLTGAGRRLEPAVMEMIRWALKTRLPSRPDDHSRPEWDLVAMKALFAPDRAGNLEGTFQLVLDELPAVMHVERGLLEMHPGRSRHADAVVEMDSVTGWLLATGALSREDATRRGRLLLEGDVVKGGRLLDCFRLS